MKLEPCPSCGQEANLHKNSSRVSLWEVKCDSCGLQTAIFMSSELAAEAWNRRTVPEPPVEEVPVKGVNRLFKSVRAWRIRRIHRKLARLNAQHLAIREVYRKTQDVPYVLMRFLRDTPGEIAELEELLCQLEFKNRKGAE